MVELLEHRKLFANLDQKANALEKATQFQAMPAGLHEDGFHARHLPLHASACVS